MGDLAETVALLLRRRRRMRSDAGARGMDVRGPLLPFARSRRKEELRSGCCALAKRCSQRRPPLVLHQADHRQLSCRRVELLVTRALASGLRRGRQARSRSGWSATRDLCATGRSQLFWRLIARWRCRSEQCPELAGHPYPFFLAHRCSNRRRSIRRAARPAPPTGRSNGSTTASAPRSSSAKASCGCGRAARNWSRERFPELARLAPHPARTARCIDGEIVVWHEAIAYQPFAGASQTAHRTQDAERSQAACRERLSR